MERRLYVLARKPKKGDRPSLDVLSAHPCRMRMPAPCGSLWASREMVQASIAEHSTLGQTFQPQEVVVFTREDYDEFAAKVQRLVRRLEALGIDPKAVARGEDG